MSSPTHNSTEKNHKKLVKSTRIDEPFNVRELATQSKCEFRTLVMQRPRKDGLEMEIFTQWWVPKDRECEGVVLFCHGLCDHGGLLARTSPVNEEVSEVEFMLSQGIAVVAMDQEGHGRSAGIHGFFHDVDAVVADGLALLHAIHADEKLGKKKVFLLGGSLGGLLEIKLLALVQRNNLAHLVNGAVISCPLVEVAADSRPSWIIEMAAKAIDQWFPSLPLAGAQEGNVFRPEIAAAMRAEEQSDPLFYKGKLRVGTGMAMLRALETLESEMSHVTAPVLLAHGESDRVCTIKGTEKLFERISSKDKQFIRYPDTHHDLLHDPKNIRQFRQDRFNWISQRLNA